jgi:hypothetical protein
VVYDICGIPYCNGFRQEAVYEVVAAHQAPTPVDDSDRIMALPVYDVARFLRYKRPIGGEHD